MSSIPTILIVGDGGVGKSALVRRLAGRAFQPYYISTCGSNLTALPQVQLCDTAGQEKERSLDTVALDSINSALVMFDVTNLVSFKNAMEWLKMVRARNPFIPITLVGNKVDCDSRRVMADDIIIVIDSLGIPYCDISCRTGYNVDRLLTRLTATN